MRTDGDSWDLASSVGATATMVAAARAMATAAPDPVIVPAGSLHIAVDK